MDFTEETQQQIIDLQNQVNELRALTYKNDFSNTYLQDKTVIQHTGAQQSSNFVTGSTGWQFDSDGNLEANSGNFRGDITGASGTFSGTVNVGSLNIPDAVTADSFHVDTTGNAYWGCTVADFETSVDNAIAYILKTGAAKFQTSITIGGADADYQITWDESELQVNKSTLRFQDIFGDGSDGDVTINSDAFSSGPITNNVLTKDAFFDNLTIDVTRSLNTAGYRLFVKGVLTNNGTIQRNGNNGGNGGNATDCCGASPTAGAGGTAGAALSAGSIYGGLAGGAGGNGGHDGTGVAGTAGSDQTISVGVAGAAGAAGGNAGAGCNPANGGAGGAAGSIESTPLNKIHTVFAAYSLYDFVNTSRIQSSAGSGGGGGGGTTTLHNQRGGGGGGAGGAGGMIAIYAKELANNGTIRALGGNGGNGGTGCPGCNLNCGGDGGGGGAAGGSGGVMILVYALKSAAGTILMTGGTAGTGGAGGAPNGTGGAGATGGAGTAGNAGVKIELRV